MKEEIKVKIAEIINSIIAKDVSEITYNEYRILDSKLKDIQFEESQQERNKEMAELMAKAFSGYGFSNGFSTLPEEKEE